MTRIIAGDCLEVMPTLEANSVDSVICDPPYGLDFMGKSWDHGVPGVEFWQAALRVAKPGAILMAFGGTRTYHRLTCAIEDAGWEIRDGMCWLYGSGFPKSLDISKAIDKAAGAEREVIGERVLTGNARRPGHLAYANIEGVPYLTDGRVDITAPATDSAKLWQGWGTALKPAWEPIIVAMKPLEGTYAENAQKWGVAGLNIDGSRIEADTNDINVRDAKTRLGAVHSSIFPLEGNGKGWDGAAGRWPANLLLDEEAARLLDEQSGKLKSGILTHVNCSTQKGSQNVNYGGGQPLKEYVQNVGGASRFFYTAKASSSERNAGLEDCEAERDADRIKDDGVGGDNPRNRSNNAKQNFHPTVKPVSLMRYLCKLTRTPTGGVVLDPFMGSGTTGIACILEHRDFIGIEIDEGYAEIARKRIADMTGPLFIPPEVKHGNSYLYN